MVVDKGGSPGKAAILESLLQGLGFETVYNPKAKAAFPDSREGNFVM